MTHLIISAVEVGESAGPKIGPTVRGLKLSFKYYIDQWRNEKGKENGIINAPQEWTSSWFPCSRRPPWIEDMFKRMPTTINGNLEIIINNLKIIIKI